MANIGWRFPPLSGGTRQGYTNNDIEVFKGQELIDNLAREICQNSLDAHANDTEEPVLVKFELRSFEQKQYAVFSQYGECLDGCRNYWGDEMDDKLDRFLTRAEKMLGNQDIPVLVASDFNTKGLNGSHSQKKSSSWEALTGSDGVSVKSDNNSAGSYGIGKNAPFACSALSMVFYNTLDEDNESAFIGVARLATLLNKQGKPTQRVGKYQNNDDANEEWFPIYDTDCDAFRDCFHRTACGTDVIIVGFTQTENWVDNITKAVMKNFFVAICEGRLIVELEDKETTKRVDASTIAQLFKDYSKDAEMTATSQLYKAFSESDSREYLSVFDDNDVELYVKADSSFKRTIANFRATGMLVGTYYKRIFQHYAAVVIVRGKELGELLKDTEPPRHNRWDYKQIESAEPEKRKRARNAIREIENFVLKTLKEQYEISTGESIDAVGVGDYLPDETDGLEGTQVGDDLLKVKVKVGKVNRSHTRQGLTTTSGTKGEGIVKAGDIHNHKKNPKPLPPKILPPKPVDPDIENTERVAGVVPGKGTKSMITPNVSAQRAFPVSSSQGVYRIVIVPTEDYNNLYIRCRALGEDGKADALDIMSCTLDGSHLQTSGDTAGPAKVKAGVPAKFYVRFNRKEKMMLNLSLMEEVKK